MRKILNFLGFLFLLFVGFSFASSTDNLTTTSDSQSGEITSDCKVLWYYDDESDVCQKKEFCGLYMYKGLKTFENEEKCKDSLKDDKEDENGEDQTSDVYNSEKNKCAKEGEFTSGPVSPKYQYGCCEGLKSFNPYVGVNDKGMTYTRVGAGKLCYNPDNGKPVCKEETEKANGTKIEEGFYYPNGKLLKEMDCNSDDNSDNINCPAVYDPVCGEKKVYIDSSGRMKKIKKTYSNKCKMGKDGAEFLYKGKCKNSDNINCPAVYDPVCGEKKVYIDSSGNMKKIKKTYSNKCKMGKDGAEFLYKGKCGNSDNDKKMEDIKEKIEKLKEKYEEIKEECEDEITSECKRKLDLLKKELLKYKKQFTIGGSSISKVQTNIKKGEIISKKRRERLQDRLGMDMKKLSEMKDSSNSLKDRIRNKFGTKAYKMVQKYKPRLDKIMIKLKDKLKDMSETKRNKFVDNLVNKVDKLVEKTNNSTIKGTLVYIKQRVVLGYEKYFSETQEEKDLLEEIFGDL